MTPRCMLIGDRNREQALLLLFSPRVSRSGTLMMKAATEMPERESHAATEAGRYGNERPGMQVKKKNEGQDKTSSPQQRRASRSFLLRSAEEEAASR